MARSLFFSARQAVLIFLAAMAYFGVRGLTEGNPAQANNNATRLLALERQLNIDIELSVHRAIAQSEFLMNVANWIYIWGHWPVVIATLVWLAVRHREEFFVLRDAMFISGAIGLVIFATWAVTPPRLQGPGFIDTVTIRSVSYRLLQPPALINKYAAVPSLHFGWNLLVGIAWARTARGLFFKAAAVLMPMAMAFAVVATANHWVADVIVGGIVALAGLALQSPVRRWFGALWESPLLYRLNGRATPPDPVDDSTDARSSHPAPTRTDHPLSPR